jgi:hypothetical protein
VCVTMGLLLLVLLCPLPCVSGLPFYNGFYYSNGAHGAPGRNPGKGHREGRRPLGLVPCHLLGYAGS